MADDGSTTRRGPEAFPDEVTFNGNSSAETTARQRRPSESTLSSRRQSYFDSQRIHRRSPSSGSQHTTATSRSKGKQPSYQASSDNEPFGVYSVPLPSAAPRSAGGFQDEFSGGSQDARYSSGRPTTNTTHSSEPTTNFSQRDGVRRRASSSQAANSTPSATTALPPLPIQPDWFTSVAQGQDFAQEPQSLEPEAQQPSAERRHSQPSIEQSIHEPEQTLQPKLWSADLYSVACVIFFSIMGTLARLGIQWLTFYPGAPIVTPVIWANFGGSLIMGFLSEDQMIFCDGFYPTLSADESDKETTPAERAAARKSAFRKHTKSIPLFIGLTTGFCGSFTSFSSFARDFFLALSDNLPTPFNHAYPSSSSSLTPSTTVSRNGGYSFEAFVAVVIYTLSLSIGALLIGAHLAEALQPHLSPIPQKLSRFFNPLMVFLGFGSWIGALFIAIFPPDTSWRGEVLFALVFAPVGALLRFYASLKLNPLISVFPLGTFAVNMFGTAVEGMCYAIQHVSIGNSSITGGGIIGCQVLQGVQDGFCGCLTTVSTWVLEIVGLRRKYGYAYAFVSVLTALCLMLVIMGSVRWSVGFGSAACNTGYVEKIYG